MSGDVEPIVTGDREYVVRLTLRGEHHDFDPVTARILPSILGANGGKDFADEIAKAVPLLCISCRDRYAHVYGDFCSVCAPDPLGGVA